MKKIVLVTGASSGIGMAFAELFARKEYDVVLVARRKETLEKFSERLLSRYGTRSIVIAKDLNDSNAPTELFNELEKRGVEIDVLINNAGTQVYGPFQETNLEKELKLLQTNIVSLTVLTKLAIQQWIKKDKKGKILNLGSTGSFMPVPLNAIYCASKAYALSFSEGIAKDLEGTGITVTALCPGATRTEFAEKAGIADIRLFSFGVMSPEAVARVGYDALVRGKRVAVPGLLNKILVVSAPFIPRAILLRVGKFIMQRK